MIDTKDERMDRAMRKTIHQDRPRVGVKLSNGAVCLAFHEKERDDRSVRYDVLAVTESGFQQFVIWTYDIGITDMATGGYGRCAPTAFWGHYHRNLEDALAAYNERKSAVAL